MVESSVQTINFRFCCRFKDLFVQKMKNSFCFSIHCVCVSVYESHWKISLCYGLQVIDQFNFIYLHDKSISIGIHDTDFFVGSEPRKEDKKKL